MAFPLIAETRTEDAAARRPAFDAVYDQWFDEVVKWVPAMGASVADAEDLAQDVFLTVRRRLPSFDGANLVGWLYAITIRVVRNHRRLAWFRRLVTGPQAEGAIAMRASFESPEQQSERRELLKVVEQVLDKVPDAYRRAFVLFEIHGYDGQEIARLEGVPLNTVWTRIHHGRRHFEKHAARFRARERA